MPSPSGPRSGRFGYMNGVPFMRSWSLNWSQALETRYHSASPSAAVRLIGIEDWNGTVEGFGGWPGIFPGDAITLKLYTAPSDGVKGSNGQVYAGTAIADSLTITWTFQPNASINYSLGFSADSCLTEEETIYTDSTSVCEASVCNILGEIASVCDIETGTGTGTGSVAAPAYGEMANVESITLTFTAQNQTIINSSTNCCTQREPGVLDWTVAVVDQEAYPIWDWNTYYTFRLWTNLTEYWQIDYGLLQDISNINVNAETGDIISKTNTFAGTARICCDNENPQSGKILDPDGTTQFP